MTHEIAPVSESPDPYLEALYGRYDTYGDDPLRLQKAAVIWNGATRAEERIQVWEILHGRAFNGTELLDLPEAVAGPIFEGAPLEIALQGIQHVLNSAPPSDATLRTAA